MDISRIIEDDISILSLSGNLLGEKDSVPIVESVSVSLSQNSNRFIVDLSNLKYINSTGLSVLITILTKSRNAGGEMVLVNLPAQLVNLLQITKLSEVFPQAASIEEAKLKYKK
ncbi:MAG: STAS domain-containing protein [Chitinophagales bacterium]|nr:STAS domain-containing protein [Bacteroidota bacterium]MCB9256837.1 STAS domain-containing protein [Chitinophagales bacterium]